uniref:Acidic leucine-rich nuclear phosphoprotein 32 family member A n=2 Tax=Cacopsylla melanoneura TaxID=428564 RepID=A0A8D8V260_9HEMI
MEQTMEKRIELEKRGRSASEITELNLDNCRSTSITALTAEFTNLETLSAINVGLTSLKGFPELPNLKRLELSDNRISGGLNVLQASQKLVYLNLCGNKIKDLETLEPLKELANLKHLDLFNNEVCTGTENYREKVFELLPSLKYLDGFDARDNEAPDSEEDMNGNEEDDDSDEEDDDDDDDDLDILNLEDSAVGSSAASEALEELLNADPCVVETEFLRGRKGKPGVRVKFQDLSKPYVPCVTIGEGNYTKFLHIVRGAEEASTLDMSPDSGINELQNLTPEEQEKQRQEWEKELVKMEEEINTLKQVLASKSKAAAELKKKLGFSVWKEFNDDISQGIKNVKETHVYQSAENLVKPVAEKATNILGGFGSGISTKLGQIKSSESFRSFEEKVGSAYENVKTKVSTSRSSSVQSFDDALAAGNRTNIVSPPSTPVIPEEKEIK